VVGPDCGGRETAEYGSNGSGSPGLLRSASMDLVRPGTGNRMPSYLDRNEGMLHNRSRWSTLDTLQSLDPDNGGC